MNYLQKALNKHGWNHKGKEVFKLSVDALEDICSQEPDEHLQVSINNTLESTLNQQLVGFAGGLVEHFFDIWGFGSVPSGRSRRCNDNMQPPRRPIEYVIQ
eukprot:6282474-Amphidinium_carterae.1